MSNLKDLSEYAKKLGAHASLKKQIEGHYTLFVCVDEVPSDYSPEITSWNHVITVDEIDGKWKVGFSKRQYTFTRLLNTDEIREIIKKWIIHPSNDVFADFENT
jgi:hypothetical protein